MGEEVRECPHCGGVSKAIWTLEGKVVKCVKCGCRTSPERTYDIAIAKWNSRVGS